MAHFQDRSASPTEVREQDDLLVTSKPVVHDKDQLGIRSNGIECVERFLKGKLLLLSSSYWCTART